MTSDIINLESGYTYTVYGTDLSGMSIYPQWYDANGYVGTGKIADGHGWNTSTTGSAKYVVSPPDGVTRMRLQGYCATTSNTVKKVTMYRVRS